MSNNKPLTGEDVMPWGKNKGTKLKDMDTGYFEWFLKQDWAADHDALYRYALAITGQQAPAPKLEEDDAPF